jgi:hypothetical protein
VPVNYDYVQLEVEDYDPQIKSYTKKTHYFWDGGILANTPLMPIIYAHRQYWYFVKRVKDAVPKLNVALIALHPSEVDKVPWDHDGVVNRERDIIFGDKTKADETIMLVISEYMGLAKKLIKIARDHGVKQKIIDDLLDQPIATQERMEEVRAVTYRDAIEGAFNIGEVIRIEKKHDEHSIANKMFDFSLNTIKQLLQEGYDDVVNWGKARFGVEYLKAAGMQYSETELSAGQITGGIREKG